MELREFMAGREREAEWQRANGYNDEKPECNGEYQTLRKLLPATGLFVDVGANQGQFSGLVMAEAPEVGLLAFEPNPSLIEALRSRLGPLGVVVPVALSDQEREATLHVHVSDSTTSSLGLRTGMMPEFTRRMRPVQVQTRVLDRYLEEIREKSGSRACCIKIDTEGFEYPVMKGGARVLGLDLPVFVLFEFSFGWKESGYTLKEAFHFLNDLGFELLRITPLGLEGVRFYTQEMESAYYCNYLAVRHAPLEQLLGKPVSLATVYGSASFFPF